MVRAQHLGRPKMRHRPHRYAISPRHGLGFCDGLCPRQPVASHPCQATIKKTAPKGGFCFLPSAHRFQTAVSTKADRAVCLNRQAARARAFTLAAKRLLSRAALFLWKMCLSAMVSTTDCILPNSSLALVLSPAKTAFSTFFTAVRYCERSEVFAALSLTS